MHDDGDGWAGRRCGSDMSSGGSGTIEAKNIAVDWNWETVIQRGFFHPGESVKFVRKKFAPVSFLGDAKWRWKKYII